MRPEAIYVVMSDSNMPAMTCGCADTTVGYFLTSFISIDNTVFSRAVYENQGGAITVDPFTDIMESSATDGDDPQWACFEKRESTTSTRRIGVVWSTPVASGSGTRIKSNNGFVTTLLYDWVYGAATIMPGTYAADEHRNHLRARHADEPRPHDRHLSPARCDGFADLVRRSREPVARRRGSGLRAVPEVSDRDRAARHAQRRGARQWHGLPLPTDTGATPVTHSWWFPAGLGKTEVLAFEQL